MSWKPPPKVKKSPGQSVFSACSPQTRTNQKAPKVRNVPFTDTHWAGDVAQLVPACLKGSEPGMEPQGQGLYSQLSVQRQEDQKFSWLHSKLEAAQNTQDFV